MLFLIHVYTKNRSVFCKYCISSLWAQITCCYTAKAISRNDAYWCPVVKEPFLWPCRIMLLLKMALFGGPAAVCKLSGCGCTLSLASHGLWTLSIAIQLKKHFCPILDRSLMIHALEYGIIFAQKLRNILSTTKKKSLSPTLSWMLR